MDPAPPQLKELLDLVAKNREASCQEILDAAQKQAADILWRAEESARKRENRAKTDEEGNRTRVLEAARAQQETELRQYRLNRTRTVLATGRELLIETLRARWQDPAHRSRWLGFLVDRANRLLPVGNWQVIHPEAWSVAELQPFAVRLQATAADEMRFLADLEIEAGLRIGCRGAWVDGTIAGITANREEIDAMLLALLEGGMGGVVSERCAGENLGG